MSILLPPLFTTVRLNTMHPDGINNIYSEIQNHFKKVNAELGADCKLKVSLHQKLSDICVIPSIVQSIKAKEQAVVVDKLCGMAIMRGADVFIPGVLAMPKGIKVGDDVAVYVHISGKCLKGMTKFHGEMLFLGNATSLVSRSDIFVQKVSKGKAFVMKECLFLAPSFDHVLPGKIFLQNIPSIVVGHVLNPQPNEMVLDMCAAPGGKLLHLYELMKGMGKVVAVDRSTNRTSKLIGNIQRMNADESFFEILTADSRTLCSKYKDQKSKFKYETFDRILLDAPCSALGQRPRIILSGDESNSSSTHSVLQKQLFTAAVDLLKVGGTLVYSTCTTTAEENEGLVEWALQEHTTISLVKQDPHVGGFGRRNVSSLTPQQLDCLQFFTLPQPIALDKFIQNYRNGSLSMVLSSDNILPEQDTIGFFISKFVKIA